ncbi:hypothetical protein [Occallatibacter savannae]|uniref:hypothetical protein n=1 Tax=Occallatibacter savannae TaxID=1002691 RepID=UPI000D687129|nr:hypothetical protein [Occallatibacter savannae]
MTLQLLDQTRRWLNLLLAVAQIAVTVFCFSFGTSFDDAAGSPSADPPIVPAGYAFIIWSVIYAGCLAYGIYQFSGSRLDDPLLRRIGFFTASGFLGCCIWLLCVRFGQLQWTVPCILWMAISLFGAFAALWRVESPSWLLRLCVISPLSIYSGWLSVAIFANTASVAKSFGWRPAVLGESAGSVALLVAAAALATFLLWQSHWNLWYGGTILWALVGIGVRNQFDLRNAQVATTAWLLLASFGLFALSNPLLTTLRTLRR